MGENSTLHQVFMSVRDGLSRTVSKLVPPKEVEDIVQETYVKICQVAHADDIKQPRSFMHTTARNLAIDYLKRAETRLADSVEDDDSIQLLIDQAELDGTYDTVASSEEFGHFCEAIRQLPKQCRKAFVLKKVYGYSQREIAQELQISQSTVEKHIAVGIQRCTLYMMQFEEGTAQRGAAQRSAANKSSSQQTGVKG